MDALCEFIEYWLGPRMDHYGEPIQTVDTCSLPKPLRKLYQFAGRWPGFDKSRESIWAVGAFSCQDSLRSLNKVEMSGENRLTFIDENQGCWVCSTHTDGDDPPVWVDGDHWNEDGEPFQGEKKVCDSLSKFLVTFVLQEIALGSRLCLSDNGLRKQFEEIKDKAVVIWENGPYVYGSDASFFLWNDVLVANIWESFWFGANHGRALKFLRENQGEVFTIGLLAGLPWRLDIGQDGSAKLRYYEWPVEEEAEVKVGTFDFRSLLSQFSEQISPEGTSANNPLMFLERRGQSYTEGNHLLKKEIVSDVFEQALRNLAHSNDKLSRLYRERWPYR
ncbi:hypothetical protein CA54_19520 [Symmachiella macrocystis]|uniref:Knr4/Smi1-like domain-containing protein n=1 Tax=Symmachiella macrocystis TaxID=2527985 RepID=A0A5C6BPD0_9PLAN|nr:hypothetical protein [Symmachiella macrocystis]TWU13126.1 hypothetical protein CA54_19520 [Symmachiella macrocystis]